MKSVQIPKHLEANLRYRGLPIPYIALIKADGQPDFRVTDQRKRFEVMLLGLCQLCGKQLGKNLFFVGGPAAAEANQYFEPAAHLECVLYAMQVCPFIVGRIDHAEVSEVQADNPDVIVGVDETYTTVSSPEWVIKKSRSYGYWKTQGGTILVRPTDIMYQTDILYPRQMGAEDWKKVEKQLK
jgi:hypothetical protein